MVDVAGQKGIRATGADYALPYGTKDNDINQLIPNKSVINSRMHTAVNLSAVARTPASGRHSRERTQMCEALGRVAELRAGK